MHKVHELLFAALVLALSYGVGAMACGGLAPSFESAEPVDQSAERILFEVEPSGRITATVDVRYEGNPSAFAWLIPVSEAPDMIDVAPQNALEALDAATRREILYPNVETCPEPRQNTGSRAGGCGVPFTVPADAFDEGGFEVEPSVRGQELVRSTPLGIVGPFDAELIEANEVSALSDWLSDNGYQVTEAIVPILEDYLQMGFSFLGVQLTPEVGVQDIQPLMFSCPAGAPTIPLKLTAIAAEPDMGVLVFIAAEERYRSMNFRTLDIPQERVHADPFSGRNNYFALVSKLIDEQGGQAFVTEFANTTENVFLERGTSDWASDLLERNAYLTRLYTRLSPEDMNDDPVFAPSGGDPVSRVQNLQDRTMACARPNIPCGDLYCGQGAICAQGFNNTEGCVCREGQVARRISSPLGEPQVVCQSDRNTVPNDDVCSGYTCGGRGECVSIGGFATCRCDPETMARVDLGRVTCVGVESRIVDGIEWSERLYSPEVVEGKAGPVELNAFVLLSLCLLGGFFWRRREA